ncbi:MAG: type II toxin-antitoxin system prevent-host-death family antitoxin [Betaproteobacteria bacterium]|nr:type II toxin-antitoxin system prevent-host-death family antitoxin [Betaproteobacteria bacterium]
MNIEIGAYEAKTKLPELLRGIQAGNRYTITHRGEPVADLVPSEGTKGHGAAAAVEQMKKFIAAASQSKGIDVKKLIGEGRA